MFKLSPFYTYSLSWACNSDLASREPDTNQAFPMHLRIIRVNLFTSICWGLRQVKGLRNLYLSNNAGESILENEGMEVGFLLN